MVYNEENRLTVANFTLMDSQPIDQLKMIVAELLARLGVDAQLSESIRSDNDRELIVINIKVKNPSLLIGQQGANLQALQYIARLMVRNLYKTDEALARLNFILDVNEYKTKRIEYLKSLAADVALRVSESGTFEAMRPMSSYERRVVHMELLGREGLVAESLGQDPNRRIVVKSTADARSFAEIAQEIEAAAQPVEA